MLKILFNNNRQCFVITILFY